MSRAEEPGTSRPAPAASPDRPDPGPDRTAAGLDGRAVLVTGARGFLGSWAVPRLLAAGASVTAMVSGRPAGDRPAAGLPLPPEVAVVTADLRDAREVERAVARVRPELVLHLGAVTHVGRSFAEPVANIEVNVAGTVNLLTALHGDYERFVHVGSGDVYGAGPVPFVEDGPISPASPYAVSKYAAERFCRMYHEAYGWPIVCLRPFNVYGPAQSRDRIIPELIAAGLAGRALRMTGGHQTREFTYVGDVADAFCRVLTAGGAEGRVLNIGCGDEVAIRDLALLVLELVGTAVAPAFGALPYRPNEIWRMFSDPRLATDLLGWRPTVGLADGLERTIRWYRDHAER